MACLAKTLLFLALVQQTLTTNAPYPYPGLAPPVGPANTGLPLNRASDPQLDHFIKTQIAPAVHDAHVVIAANLHKGQGSYGYPKVGHVVPPLGPMPPGIPTSKLDHFIKNQIAPAVHNAHVAIAHKLFKGQAVYGNSKLRPNPFPSYNNGYGHRSPHGIQVYGKINAALYAKTGVPTVHGIPGIKYSYGYTGGKLGQIRHIQLARGRPKVLSGSYGNLKNRLRSCDHHTMNPIIYGCCNRRTYRLATQMCCGNRVITRSIQYCINGMVRFNYNTLIDSPKDYFCGTETYDFGTHRCCGTEPYKFDLAGCCGNRVYQKYSQQCTGGVIYEVNAHQPCTNEYTDKSKYGCCNGETYQYSYQGCCSGKVYYLSYQKCENDHIEYFSANSRNCGGVTMVGDYLGCCYGKLYEHDYQECCDDQVIDRETQYCNKNNLAVYRYDGMSYCGGEAYQPASQGCCHGAIYDLYTHACCGYSKYDISTHFCKDDYVYALSSGVTKNFYNYYADQLHASQLESNPICIEISAEMEYDPTKNGCCYEKIYSKKFQACCGGYVYDRYEQVCCMNDKGKYYERHRSVGCRALKS